MKDIIIYVAPCGLLGSINKLFLLLFTVAIIKYIMLLHTVSFIQNPLYTPGLVLSSNSMGSVEAINRGGGNEQGWAINCKTE